MSMDTKRLLWMGSLAMLLVVVAPSVCAEGTVTNASPSVADLALRDPFTSPFATAKPVVAPGVTPTVSPNMTPVAPVLATQVAPPPDHSAELRAALQVQGFLKQGERQLAMVGGRLVGVGEVLQVRVGAAKYRFRVLSIQGTAVKFEPLP